MVPTKSDPPLLKSLFAKGSFTYHHGTSGELTVINTGVPSDAPPDATTNGHDAWPIPPSARSEWIL